MVDADHLIRNEQSIAHIRQHYCTEIVIVQAETHEVARLLRPLVGSSHPLLNNVNVKHSPLFWSPIWLNFVKRYNQK